jgi:hypothetical protein
MLGTWDDASRALGRSAVWVTFAVLFVIAIGAVFFGFIGYYSRVSLGSELRQKNEVGSVDFLFMSMAQIEEDEKLLNSLRQSYKEEEAKAAVTLAELREKAFTSEEFAEYLRTRARIVTLFGENRTQFTNEYWKEINQTLFSGINESTDSDNFQKSIALWSSPSFRKDVDTRKRGAISNELHVRIEEISKIYFNYNALRLQPLYERESREPKRREPYIRDIRVILDRSPQLATLADQALMVSAALPPIERAKDEQNRVAQQRAIVRSFDNLFIGSTRRILEWPTIASTLLVTLATGWLGGLVNFIGAVIRKGDRHNEVSAFVPSIGSLLRRSFLGVTAALGIFLAAGSGLLVLTAQTASTAGVGAIELSPYFVAFLAFISGFLADDAFARLAHLGRKLFEIKDTQELEVKQPQAKGQVPGGVGAEPNWSSGEPGVSVHEVRPVLVTHAQP